MTGPPLSISMDFIAGGLVELIGGLACASCCSRYAWWAPLRARRRVAGDALAAARERASGATATPRRSAARSATPTTPTGSPSIRRRRRSCGCSAWPAGRIDRFVERRTRLHALQYEATRLREQPVLWSLLLVVGANVARVLVARADAARAAASSLGEVVVFAQSAVGTSMIAFGGLNWALDGAAAPVAAVLRLEPAMAPAGALPVRQPRRRPACRRARSASAT